MFADSARSLFQLRSAASIASRDDAVSPGEAMTTFSAVATNGMHVAYGDDGLEGFTPQPERGALPSHKWACARRTTVRAACGRTIDFALLRRHWFEHEAIDGKHRVLYALKHLPEVGERL